MLEQNSFAAATPTYDGKRLTTANLEIHSAQNFLAGDFFDERSHRDHGRSISLGRRRHFSRRRSDRALHHGTFNVQRSTSNERRTDTPKHLTPIRRHAKIT